MSEPRTSDPNVDRAIRSWLHEDRHEDVSRLAGAVLDQVDTIPQRRATWWPARRTPVMNKSLTFGLGAAAVVVLAILLGTQLLGAPGGTGAGDDPSPTATAESTPDPTPPPSAVRGLPEGPHLIRNGLDDDGETLHPPLTITIPAPGWDGDAAGGILLKGWPEPEGAGMIIFAQQEYQVFGDACNWETVPATTVTTVDEFVAALAAQPSRDASEPVEVSVGGCSGESMRLRVPDDADVSECDQGDFGSWNCGDPADQSPCGFVGGPGETSTEYILDVDGVIMAWHTGYGPEASADLVAEVEAIVQSATFGE